MIGLSLSRCVRDIVAGRPVEVLNGFQFKDRSLHPHYVRWWVNEPDVSLVVVDTKAEGEEEWQNLLQMYSSTPYWRKKPKECVEIANLLKRSGRIVQPRVTDSDLIHFGHWVSRPSLVTPSMEFPMAPEVEEWWLTR